jgi:hypothetical protein
MKKFYFLGLVLALLAFTAAPVAAKLGQGIGISDRGSNQAQASDPNRETSINSAVKNNRPSQAQLTGQGNRESTPFYLQGTIATIDKSTMTLTIDVIHGNSQVKSFLGSTITVTASDMTDIFKLTQGNDTESTDSSLSTQDEEAPANKVTIQFDQLAVKDVVAIHGRLVNGSYQATLITVYMNLPAGQPGAEQPEVKQPETVQHQGNQNQGKRHQIEQPEVVEP